MCISWSIHFHHGIRQGIDRSWWDLSPMRSILTNCLRKKRNVFVSLYVLFLGMKSHFLFTTSSLSLSLRACSFLAYIFVTKVLGLKQHAFWRKCQGGERKGQSNVSKNHLFVIWQFLVLATFRFAITQEAGRIRRWFDQILWLHQIRSNTCLRSLCIDADDSEILLGGDFVVYNLFILLLNCGKRREIFPSGPRKKVCLGEKTASCWESMAHNSISPKRSIG